MKKVPIIFCGALLYIIAASCGDYQAAIKSSDPEFKYNVAKKLFEEEEYQKAYPLFDDLLILYRGTQRAAEVYFYYAETSFYMEDYILASYHYKNFSKTFPNHPKTEMADYMTGYCYYLQSPEPSLDQTYTLKAINELQLFANLYPNSNKLLSVNELIDALRAKLERKAFDRAKLYYKTSHYQAAVVSFNNVLDQFPDTEYREEVLYYTILSAYRLADNSILSKKRQRFIEGRTAYREFLKLYPNSEYAKEVNFLYADIEETIKQLKSQS
jgi:outer membrane protein assembly factor BamD